VLPDGRSHFKIRSRITACYSGICRGKLPSVFKFVETISWLSLCPTQRWRFIHLSMITCIREFLLKSGQITPIYYTRVFLGHGQAVAPERIWKWGGAPIRRKVPENFFWSWPSTFLALKVQLVILVSAFVMVSTVWSVSFLLFFYSRRPPCQAISKSGRHCTGDSFSAPRTRWHQRWA